MNILYEFFTNFFKIITIEDLIFAAVSAFFLTSLVLTIGRIYKEKIRDPKDFEYKEKEFNRIFQKCCLLFPNKMVNFKGEVFTRGMMVKITTIQDKTFSGKLVGLNSENFICLITANFIAADTIDNIRDITPFDDIA